MKFTLIRHSRTQIDPQRPIVLWGLSGEGIAKANALSTDPLICKLDGIYSSLQTKAIETMVYLAKPNAIPMHTHDGLTEITSFTNAFITGDEYTRSIKDYYSRAIDRVSGGETINEALARFTAALEDIANAEPDAENIGIVTHGYILSFFTGHYSDTDPYELHHQIDQPDIAVFDYDTKRFDKFWG